MKTNTCFNFVRNTFLYLLVSFSLLAGSDDLDRLRADFERGFLTFDELMIRQITRLIYDTSVSRKISTRNPIKCGTHVLKILAENHHLLSDSTKAVLSAIGIDFNRAIPGFLRPSDLEEIYDTGLFRFHYTIQGEDAVDDTDEDINGIPDYVQTMASVFNEVADIEIGLYGYTRPPSDEWYEDNGGNGLFDIYIKQLGNDLYGYTQWESLANNLSGDNEFSQIQEKNASTSYLVMRNNYDDFPYSELESIQVTAAHEFFHAIQFGYDAWEATWLLEATATWMEDEFYDDINDNYQYLKEWFAAPQFALNYDSGPHWYGSWIFFRYLSEHIGGSSTIQKIFDKSIQNDSQLHDSSIQSIDSALRELGSSFKKALKSMIIANSILSADPIVGIYSYEEADNYRGFGISPKYKQSILLQTNEYLYDNLSAFLMHNACHYLEVTVAEGPLEVKFYSETDATFQVVGIIQQYSGSVIAYNLGSSSIISIPQNTRQFTVAVVTDSIKNVDYDYSFIFRPNIALPFSIILYQNFPNPFNKTTSFRFFLPQVEPITFTIFDLGGREVANVNIPILRQGFNDATFEAQDLSSGIYIARLEGRKKTVIRKIAYVK